MAKNPLSRHAQEALNERLWEAWAVSSAPALVQALSDGADPDARDEGGNTCLILACARPREDIFDALLAAGANPRLAGRRGSTALHRAAESGNLRRTRALLDAGANPSHANRVGETPLMWTSRFASMNTAAALLEAGADARPLNVEGLSAAEIARHAGHSDFALWLENAIAARAEAQALRENTPSPQPPLTRRNAL